MALDPTQIYHGPIVKIGLRNPAAAVVEYFGFGENNCLIEFTPVEFTLNDGQIISGYGEGKIEVEFAETPAAFITALKARRLELTDFLVYTSYTAVDSYTRFEVTDLLITYKTKRQFGEEPHMAVVTGSKKALNESNFVSRVVVTP